MNELTRKFHEAQFPGWRPTKPHKEIVNIDEFFDSNLPFLEMDIGLDPTEAMKWVESNQEHFIAMQSIQKRENEAREEGKFWYFTPHAGGWEQMFKFGPRLLSQDHLCVGSNAKAKTGGLNTFVKDGVPGLVEKLNEKGFEFSKFAISKLLPNGWAQPHRDRFIKPFKKLHWVWMPLHDAQPSLKVYPYGYIKPKVGCLYFFSNMGYVHSIVNKDNFPRYVAMGTLDPEKCSLDFDKIKECVKSQWFNQ